jgi:hypothetical protein
MKALPIAGYGIQMLRPQYCLMDPWAGLSRGRPVSIGDVANVDATHVRIIWSTLPNAAALDMLFICGVPQFQVSTEIFAASFPGAAEAAETFRYFEAYTYLGSDSYDRIALANQIAGQQPTRFSAWARMNCPARAA